MDIIKAKTSSIIPIDILDSLSINEIIELHNLAVNEEFTIKYNKIQTLTKSAVEIQDSEKLILLLNEINEFENMLYENFEKEIGNELISRQKESKKKNIRNIMHSMASLIIPYFDTPNTAKTIVVNSLQLANQNEIAKKIDDKICNSIKLIENTLEILHIADKQTFLDFVNVLKIKYVSKLKIFN